MEKMRLERSEELDQLVLHSLVNCFLIEKVRKTSESF